MKYAILISIQLFLFISCTTPERAPIIPPAPVPIIITVRGGDQSTRSEHPIYERYLQRNEPQFEETLYQRKPVYEPERTEGYSVPSTNYPYTRPDPVDQIPLEPYRPKYPPYYDK